MSLHPDCTKLCVSAKKKTLVFVINNRVFSLVNHIPSKETPMSMDWIDDTLFVGCKIAYYLQDAMKGVITRTVLTKSAKTWTSMVASSISSHSECLLLDSDNTIFMVDKFGNSTHSVCIYLKSTFIPITHGVDGGTRPYYNSTNPNHRTLSLLHCGCIELLVYLQYCFAGAHSENPSPRQFPHCSECNVHFRRT